MRLLSIVLLAFFMIVPSVCQAEKFNKDGYELDLEWQQIDKNGRKELHVVGKIRGGETRCLQLNIKLDFVNSKDDSASARGKVALKRYNQKYWNRFRTVDEVSVDMAHAKYWQVDNIYIKCTGKLLDTPGKLLDTL